MRLLVFSAVEEEEEEKKKTFSAITQTVKGYLFSAKLLSFQVHGRVI